MQFCKEGEKNAIDQQNSRKKEIKAVEDKIDKLLAMLTVEKTELKGIDGLVKMAVLASVITKAAKAEKCAEKKTSFLERHGGSKVQRQWRQQAVAKKRLQKIIILINIKYKKKTI